ncbi:MAG: FG-GAP-like repeat-containing protein [Proteobacteria bacterium]|nr:FG-GAP-like repeat-containing protein [Pseudomonadota bacterium]
MGLLGLLTFGCGDGGGPGPKDPAPLPSPSCAADGGTATVAAPTLAITLKDRFEEGWLGSPAVVDLDGDGTLEIVVPRDDQLIAWHADGQVAWRAAAPGRIWSSPVVVDLTAAPGLEVAIASRDQILAFDATGALLPGFPFTFRDELRALAAGDLDGDGKFELVAVSTTRLEANGQRDVISAVRGDGTLVSGFPPNTTGAAGCDAACYVTGGFDQTLALGDVDYDGIVDVFVPQDNAYMSLHAGTGRAFDAAAIFRDRTKFSGIRWMLDYGLAQQGFANDEAVDEQAHFTNSAPAIADLDGDGKAELVVLGSVQNASQADRLRGVTLFVANHDGTRPAAWVQPPRFPTYLSGLWDYGDNLVAITNQVAIADLDPAHPGLEIVFAGFDGAIHAVDAQAMPLWSTPYTTSATVGTTGVAIADLSGDGSPEIVFATYGSEGDLVVLDAAGNLLHRVPLGGRGAMSVPTIADVDGDGDLDIVVSLKDAVDQTRSVLVFEVPGSSTKCLPWATGRGNLRRDGYVPPIN